MARSAAHAANITSTAPMLSRCLGTSPSSPLPLFLIPPLPCLRVIPPPSLMPSPSFSLCGLVLWPFDSLMPFCRRLSLLPRLVDIFTRRFHVASSAPRHHFLEIQAPLSLKQRIFVRRARVSDLYWPFSRLYSRAFQVPLALNVSLLCPSPHVCPPSLAPHPLRR